MPAAPMIHLIESIAAPSFESINILHKCTYKPDIRGDSITTPDSQRLYALAGPEI